MGERWGEERIGEEGEERKREERGERGREETSLLHSSEFFFPMVHNAPRLLKR